MSKKIEIDKSKLMEAYKAANDEQMQFLVNWKSRCRLTPVGGKKLTPSSK